MRLGKRLRFLMPGLSLVAMAAPSQGSARPLAQTVEYRPVLVIGAPVADGRLDDPYGVAMDGSGNAYVADTVNSRVQVFDKQGASPASGAAGALARGNSSVLMV